MSDRRVFLKSLLPLPLSAVLANPRISRAVSAGSRDVEAALDDGWTVKVAHASQHGQGSGGMLLIHEFR